MPGVYLRDPVTLQVYLFDEMPEPGTVRADLVQITEQEANAQPTAEPPSVVPESVTPWQILKALNRIEVDGVPLRDTVEAFVAQQSRDVRDGWARASEFRRDDPLLNAMAPLLGIDLDEVFTLAATL